jgi:hypothetical protein
MSAPRRFLALDDPEPEPKLWRRWALLAVCLGAVAAAVIVLSLHGSDRGHPRGQAPPVTPTQHLPAGARPLPGATGTQAQSIATLGPARAAGKISRDRAIRDYDLITGAARRSHHRVLTALVQVVFLDQGQLRRGDFWIVSVWFHPGFAGTGPSAWCVDHGLVNASTGRPSGHIYSCPLSAGTRPQAVRSRKVTKQMNRAAYRR